MLHDFGSVTYNKYSQYRQKRKKTSNHSITFFILHDIYAHDLLNMN